VEYVAPEVIDGSGHSFAVDLWALGILLYELIAGATPFRADGNAATFARIKQGCVDYPPEPEPGSGALVRQGHDGSDEEEEEEEEEEDSDSDRSATSAGTVTMSSACRALVEALLVSDPRHRLGAGVAGAAVIRQHRWFAGVHWALLRNDAPPLLPPLLQQPSSPPPLRRDRGDDDNRAAVGAGGGEGTMVADGQDGAHDHDDGHDHQPRLRSPRSLTAALCQAAMSAADAEQQQQQRALTPAAAAAAGKDSAEGSVCEPPESSLLEEGDSGTLLGGSAAAAAPPPAPAGAAAVAPRVESPPPRDAFRGFSFNASTASPHGGAGGSGGLGCQRYGCEERAPAEGAGRQCDPAALTKRRLPPPTTLGAVRGAPTAAAAALAAPVRLGDGHEHEEAPAGTWPAEGRVFGYTAEC
jgi:hypothetical protein